MSYTIVSESTFHSVKALVSVHRVQLLYCLFLSTALMCGVVAGNDALDELAASIPQRPAGCTDRCTKEIRRTANLIDEWAAELAWNDKEQSADQVLKTVHEFVDAKQRIDDCLDQVLKMRNSFVALEEDTNGREHVRQFLAITAQLINLSSRLRYSLRDVIDNATYDLTPSPEHLEAMIDLLTSRRVSIGATVMSYALFDPPPESDANPFSMALKRKVLTLIRATKQTDLLDELAKLVHDKNTPDGFRVEIADVILDIGLPQDPFPGDEQTKLAITARTLKKALLNVDFKKLDKKQKDLYGQVRSKLTNRRTWGIKGDVFRFGNLELKSGDWLLMRNPSPYNMFTDLSPGLFTHVGVVSVTTDKQGIRRFVIVDLPERGDRIPAMNVEKYLKRTLHFFFLRHRDEQVQKQMGAAAGETIGNETQFDLTFKTERVLALQDKPLKGQRINTYCAGYLLICAQATGRPRSDFFPIPEYRVGGHCGENFAKLGISFGKDFVSPTGAIFSPSLDIVARREAMYSPAREVKESIYDHFAKVMIERKLTPSPTTYQALREKMAGLSKFNPWLAKTLAKANNVSEHMDLQSAAKAATVIETLDEIADSNRDGFFAARRSITAGPVDELTDRGFSAEQIKAINQYRLRHSRLFLKWIDGQISPRDLRIQLVSYYAAQGKRSIEDRFFSE